MRHGASIKNGNALCHLQEKQLTPVTCTNYPFEYQSVLNILNRIPNVYVKTSKMRGYWRVEFLVGEVESDRVLHEELWDLAAAGDRSIADQDRKNP